MAGKSKRPDFGSFLTASIKQAKASMGNNGLDEVSAPPASEEVSSPEIVSPNCHDKKGSQNVIPVRHDEMAGRNDTPARHDKTDSHFDYTESNDKEPRHSGMPNSHDKQARQTDQTNRPDNLTGINGMSNWGDKETDSDTVSTLNDMTNSLPTRNRGGDNSHGQLALTKHNSRHAHAGPKNLLASSSTFTTHNQLTIINYLTLNGDHITNVPKICEQTQVQERTTRRILTELEEAGYIRRTPWREGKRQGILIELLPPMLDIKPNRQSQLSMLNGSAKEEGQLAVPNPTYIERKKENLSIESINKDHPLLSMTKEDFSFFWPNLTRVNFGPSQIKQAVEKLLLIGKALDKELFESLREGLNHADAALENSSGKLIDQHGKIVENPCAYIYRALAKDGYYAAPKGYISPEAKRLNDQIQKAKFESEALKQLEEIEKENEHFEILEHFKKWRDSLSEHDLTIIEKSSPPHIKKGRGFENWLRTYYFPKNILKK